MAGLTIRRLLTDTPLAREHQLLTEAKARHRLVAIPWSRFERARYPEAALARAYGIQRNLVAGEYLAVNSFAHMTSALAMAGAPFDLVSAAARIPSEELRHAEYALRMAALLAGTDVAAQVVTVAPEEVELRHKLYGAGPFSLERLDLLMIDVPCFGETLATGLLLAARDRARDPVVRALHGALVSDEVRHARLGWYYLAWRAPQWSVAERRRVARHAGEQVAAALPRYGRGHDAPGTDNEALAALGVLDTTTQREAVARVMEEEIVPGFDALGLGASQAWRRGREPEAGYERHPAG